MPDTPLSHRNTQPGWIAAPGMQGTQVGPITAGLLTPESLAELMGGPDIGPLPSACRPRRDRRTPTTRTRCRRPSDLQPRRCRSRRRRRRPGGPGSASAPSTAGSGPAPAGPPLPAEAGPLRHERDERDARVRCSIATGPGRGWLLLVAALVLTRAAVARHRECADARRSRQRAPAPTPSTCRCRTRWRSTSNSRVRVADVFVGTVRAIELKNWVATLTLDLDKNVKLPKNATAKIGQTSLLGSQHVELAAPPNPSPQLLKNGDTIPLKNSSAYPDDRADAGQSRHRSCAAAASRTSKCCRTRSTTS